MNRAEILALAGILASSAALSAELGNLNVDSKPGEPFSARLEVTDIDHVKAPLQVRLAPEKFYTETSSNPPAGLSGMKLSLESMDPCIVRIRGSQDMVSQAFDLIVQIREDGAIRSKIYRIEAGTAAIRGGAAAAGQEKPEGPGKAVAENTGTGSAVQPAASVQDRPVRDARPSPAKKQVKAAGPKRVDPSTLEPVTLPLDPKDYDLSKPFLVRPGMTMWSIAVLYSKRYPKCLVQQVIVGFVRANPDCFEGGRADGVIFGSYLRAPSLKAVRGISKAEAIDLVNRHPGRSALKKAGR